MVGQLSPSMSTVESLNLSLTAHKSLLSEYALRTKQAEQLANTLLNDRVPAEVMYNLVGELMKEHSEHRASERAVHQQAVLQAALFALQQVQYTEDLEQVRSIVNNVVSQITLSLGAMHNPPQEKG